MALVIGNPVEYGIHDLLIFPIGANYNPKIEEHTETAEAFDSDKKYYSVQTLSDNNVGSFKVNETSQWDYKAKKEYVNQNEEDFDIRNILFYDKKSGGSYTLSVDTLHVLSFAIHNEFKHPLIFYRVVKMDINKDKKYNSQDAVMLYVSELDGKKFVQITPPDEQFFDYFYYPETQSILIKTTVDIDKNSKFTELDETNFREMRLAAPAFGREIFTQSLKDSLKREMSIFK